MTQARKMYLVTGGSGYFGETLVQRLLARGEEVGVLDLNPPSFDHPRMRVFIGDIRDKAIVAQAVANARIVLHNVAQVPLAKDREQFWSVNEGGTRTLLDAALAAGVERLVYTSSSAVFGVPEANPVTEATAPTPMEEYGAAKLSGERLCQDYARRGLATAIVRPRTILGHGRLGIFQILFEWIYQGRNLPVLGGGDNLYQFVHADDLADAILLAAEKPGECEIYNIGGADYGTMRGALEGLIRHAGSPSKVKSLPKRLSSWAMDVAGKLGLLPLGAYHALMYGESLYFDTAKARDRLGYAPKYTTDQMFADSYDWYVANRARILAGGEGRSHHQSKVKQGLLQLVPYVLR